MSFSAGHTIYHLYRCHSDSAPLKLFVSNFRSQAGQCTRLCLVFCDEISFPDDYLRRNHLGAWTCLLILFDPALSQSNRINFEANSNLTPILPFLRFLWPTLYLTRKVMSNEWWHRILLIDLTPPWVHDKSSFGELLNPEINEPGFLHLGGIVFRVWISFDDHIVCSAAVVSVFFWVLRT